MDENGPIHVSHELVTKGVDLVNPVSLLIPNSSLILY